jgi:hypothetical protein
MPLLLGFGLLIALWMFIRWDQARLKRDSDQPITRQQMSHGFRPGSNIKLYGTLGASLMSVVWAGIEFIQPSIPPYSGKYSSIRQALYDSFGVLGLPMLLLLLAFGFAGYAWHLRASAR